MELYVFNRNLEFLGIIDTYFSLIWTRKYYKSGEFELHCDLTPENLNLLKRENIIWKKDDIEAGYIEFRNLKQDNEGKETLVIKGKLLTGYLNRRIIWGNEIFNDTTENSMRKLVDKNCINTTDVNRIIPNLVLGDLKEYTQRINYQVSYKNLLGELENLSNISDLSYRIKFDQINKKLIFDVYYGLDRSVNQSINPRCIFSKEFENILEQEYIDSLNNYRNVTLIGGTGEGLGRKFATIGNSTGLDRFELFTDARELSNTKYVDNVEVNIPDSEYIPMLIEKGNSKIAECIDVRTFDSKINLNSNLKYKVDFDLGDIVTCTSKKWGITLNTRITEIEEIYEESGLQINITFGNNVPTLIDKIKQQLK